MSLVLDRGYPGAASARIWRDAAPGAESSDVAAVRKALGQPRAQGEASPAPPPGAAPRPAPRPPVKAAPTSSSRLALAAMVVVGAAGLMTGGLLAMGAPEGHPGGPGPARATAPAPASPLATSRATPPEAVPGPPGILPARLVGTPRASLDHAGAPGTVPEPLRRSVPAPSRDAPPASVDQLVAAPPGLSAWVAAVPRVAPSADMGTMAPAMVAGVDLAASARTLPARAALGYPTPPRAPAPPSEQVAAAIIPAPGVVADISGPAPAPPAPPSRAAAALTISTGAPAMPEATRAPAKPSGAASRAAAPPIVSTGAVSPAGARVVIHYDRRAWTARPEALAEDLRRAGFGRVEWRGVDLGIGASQTRFFRAADMGLSGRVARVLAAAGRPAAQRDFTHFSPPPSPGTIEVWLAR